MPRQVQPRQGNPGMQGRYLSTRRAAKAISTYKKICCWVIVAGFDMFAISVPTPLQRRLNCGGRSGILSFCAVIFIDLPYLDKTGPAKWLSTLASAS
jgi:hypothetical protein